MKINIKAPSSLVLAILLMSGSAFAYTNINSKQNQNAGYIGIQFGYGNTHYNKKEKIDIGHIYSSNVTHTGFAGRMYFGYDFNHHFAIESGFIFLPKVTFHNIYQFDGLNLNFNQNILDVLGKVTFSLPHKIDLYSKAGIADIITCNYNISQGRDEVQGDDHYSSVVPAIGTGVDYGFNDNVFADLSYMHYFGKQDSFKPMDFIGLGLAYRF